MSDSTIVFFHAHPDDEALISAGTIARAVDAGHRVVLVLATDGGAGTCDPGVLAEGETLAQRRWAEAETSAAALGVSRTIHLGYGDSGARQSLASPLKRTNPVIRFVKDKLIPQAVRTWIGRTLRTWPAKSLCAADPAEVAEKLAAVLRQEGAALLVADDSVGGYGHPDHVRVHEAAAAASARLGLPLVEVTIDREFLAGGIELAASLGLEVPDGFVPPDMSNWYTPHDQITHTVDVSSTLSRKRASMAAHETQATSDSGFSVRTLAVFLSLPEDIYAIAFGTEWFIIRDELPAEFAALFTPVTM